MVESNIIDIHCHIASDAFFPPSFRSGIAENMAAVLRSNGISPDKEKIERLYSAKMQDPDCDRLIEEMDAAGIGLSVLLLPDFTFALRDCELTIEEMIDRHRAVMERHEDRLRAFVGVDPRWGQDGLTLFEKAIEEYGFHGLKLYPPCGYQPSDRLLYPYYEICSAGSLPVLVHIGATSPALPFDDARPLCVDHAAKDFPDVDFILAHGSVHYQDECAMLCRNRPNVFLDVSGFQGLDLSLLRSLFRRGVNHKILFGTDWPIFRLQGTQKDFVDRLRQGDAGFPAAMGAREKRSFLHGNAERILSKDVRFSVRDGASSSAEHHGLTGASTEP